MTTRRWMAGGGGIATGAWRSGGARRAGVYRSRAAYFRERELIARAVVCIEAGVAQYQGCDFTIPDDFDPATAHLRSDDERYRRLFFHYRLMRRKYEHAALYPWFLVGPD